MIFTTNYTLGPFSFSLVQFCSAEMSRTATDMDIRFFTSDRENSFVCLPFTEILIFDQKIGEKCRFL